MSVASRKFISDEDLKEANVAGDEIWYSLYREIDVGDHGDPAAVAYALWRHLTFYLAEDIGGRGRWTPADLARDALEFAEGQQQTDGWLAKKAGKRADETWEELSIRRWAEAEGLTKNNDETWEEWAQRYAGS